MQNERPAHRHREQDAAAPIESIVRSAASDPQEIEVATRMTCGASPGQIWSQLMFYEQLEGRPPLHLRLVLPVPIRTTGDKTHVGDQAHCLYEGGHLIKRITVVEHERRYAFEVIEQALQVGNGMSLRGGAYDVEPRASGTSEVTLSTRYVSVRKPRWLWRPIEAAVCHSFHRHILRAVRRGAEAG